MNINEYRTLHETKNHNKPDFPYNTYLCSIPMDFTQVAPHWHNDIELIVVKKGRGLITLDTQPFMVEEGHIVVVLPGRIHAISTYQNHCMEYENIIFHTSLLYTNTTDRLTKQYFQLLLEESQSITAHITPDLSNYAQLYQCIVQIDILCSTQPSYYELMIKSHLYAFFFQLFSYTMDRCNLPPNDSLLKVKSFITYVENNYTSPITTSTAAHHLGISTSHFMKLFRELMHITFTEYLNQYRLETAGALLRTTSDSILSISIQVGYNNLSYFNRIFKEYYGISPRAYRNNI